MSIQEQLKEVVDNNEVILFMKGSPDFPQCGFSGRTAQILQACDVRYASVDVLSDHAVREGIKEFSNWPTVPTTFMYVENLLVVAILLLRCMRAVNYKKF